MSGIIIRDNAGLLKNKTVIGENGLIEMHSSQNITAILDQNKRDQNDSNFRNGYSEDGDMKHVARVPLIIWKQWWIEEKKRQGRTIPLYGKEMNEIVRKKLNDPDNKFLRTGGGEIGRGR